jgi:hypothetical protein
VYVDSDPMASNHATALMAGSGVVTVQADLRDPERVLGDPRIRDLLDFEQPIGSSHMTSETRPEAAEKVFQMTQDLHWNTPLVSRSREDIARFFDGYTLVEPGLVPPAPWRPDLDNPLRVGQAGGGEAVLETSSAGLPKDDRGVAWHLCGIGAKNS